MLQRMKILVLLLLRQLFVHQDASSWFHLVKLHDVQHVPNFEQI